MFLESYLYMEYVFDILIIVDLILKSFEVVRLYFSYEVSFKEENENKVLKNIVEKEN